MPADFSAHFDNCINAATRGVITEHIKGIFNGVKTRCACFNFSRMLVCFSNFELVSTARPIFVEAFHRNNFIIVFHGTSSHKDRLE